MLTFDEFANLMIVGNFNIRREITSSFPVSHRAGHYTEPFKSKARGFADRLLTEMRRDARKGAGK